MIENPGLVQSNFIGNRVVKAVTNNLITVMDVCRPGQVLIILPMPALEAIPYIGVVVN